MRKTILLEWWLPSGKGLVYLLMYSKDHITMAVVQLTTSRNNRGYRNEIKRCTNLCTILFAQQLVWTFPTKRRNDGEKGRYRICFLDGLGTSCSSNTSVLLLPLRHLGVGYGTPFSDRRCPIFYEDFSRFAFFQLRAGNIPERITTPDQFWLSSQLRCRVKSDDRRTSKKGTW